MNELVSLPMRNLSRRPSRSVITLLGVVIGVSAIVSLVSMGEGLQAGINEQFQRLGPNVLIVYPGSASRFGGASSCVMTDEDVDRILDVRGVKDASGICTRIGTVCRGSECFVKGITLVGKPEIFEDIGFKIEKGRAPLTDETNKIAIGSTFGETYFDREFKVGDRLKLDDDAVQVVGIYEKTGDPNDDNSMVMGLDGGRKFFGGDQDRVSSAFVMVTESYEPDEVAERLKIKLERGSDKEFSVQTSQDLLETVGDILGAVSGVFIGIAAISIVVGGVGITNTMYMSILERTREIGVMKAIGATRDVIRNLIMVEAGLLGMTGGLAGVFVGWSIAVVATDLIRARLASDIFIARISPQLVFFALSFSFVVGMVSGYLPARNAARLKPIEALRYE